MAKWYSMTEIMIANICNNQTDNVAFARSAYWIANSDLST